MVQAYDYDPYGNPTVTPATGSLADFRYAGMFYHADSGLYLTQYRVYDPRTARWLSRDLIGENGGTNLYSYALRNPLWLTDRLGLQSVFLTGKVTSNNYINPNDPSQTVQPLLARISQRG